MTSPRERPDLPEYIVVVYRSSYQCCQRSSYGAAVYRMAMMSEKASAMVSAKMAAKASAMVSAKVSAMVSAKMAAKVSAMVSGRRRRCYRRGCRRYYILLHLFLAITRKQRTQKVAV